MQHDEKYSLGLLSDLCTANGISGFEDEVVEVAKKYAADYASLTENSLRNLYIKRNANTGGKPVVMLDAHSDELGFVVQNIKPNGTLSFLPIGGWLPRAMSAHKVRVLSSTGEYVTGVIASKPPHFMSDSEKHKELSIDDMVIDVGACSKDEVINDFKIELGAPIIPDVGFEYNARNGTILTKALDNRLGCAAVIETIKQLAQTELAVDVVGSLTAQEEVGRRGADAAVNFIKPQVAIVFEGTPADDTFLSVYDAQSTLRHGPQIRHFDKSMISSPRFTKLAKEIAKKHGIKYQEAVRSGGGTNAGAIHIANDGIPCIVLGVPTRYAHSHHCYCALEDYQNTVALAVEVIKALNEEIVLSF